jgi:hypothetical protein
VKPAVEFKMDLPAEAIQFSKTGDLNRCYKATLAKIPKPIRRKLLAQLERLKSKREEIIGDEKKTW